MVLLASLSLLLGLAGFVQGQTILPKKVVTQSLNGIVFADQFGLSDIGANINSADGSCTASADVVCPTLVSPQPGTALNFTTPILLNTPNRVHLLDFGGAYLNYTPTTATTALTADWIQDIGSGYIVAHGIRHLSLRNNNCSTVGGCGNPTVGIAFGGTHSGMQNGYTLGVRVQGFGTAMTYPNTGTTSWGNDHFHCSLDLNTLGVDILGEVEAPNFYGCKFAVNGTAIRNNSTSDIAVFGGSMDSNTVAGYVGTGQYFDFGQHIENNGSTVLNYANNSGIWAKFGGVAIDDQTTGTTASMFTNTSGVARISGAAVISLGRTITNLFNVVAGHVSGDYFDTTGKITSPCATFANCALEINTANGTTLWGDRTYQGHLYFRAPSGVDLGPLHFANAAAGTDLWAIGNKDNGGSSTDDLVISATASTGFGQNMAARILASTGFWTNFRYDTAGTNNVFRVGGAGYPSGAPATGQAVVAISPTTTAWMSVPTVPTFTLKKGSGAGNYSSASTTYVAADGTNLSYTVTILTGSKLLIHAQGSVTTSTAIATASVNLTDGTCGSGTVLQELQSVPTAASNPESWALGYIVTGDGASHTINLCYKTSAGADSVTLLNSSSSLLPTMTFMLSSSN